MVPFPIGLNKKGEIKMMENKYMDFDAFFGEMEKKKGPVLKLFDKEYELPTEMPAGVMLDTYRAYKKGDKVISDEQQMDLAFKMLGEENVNEWCEKGLTVNQLTEIMKWAAVNQSEESTGNGGKK